MKVLVVYENVPESTDFYSMEVNDGELKKLRLCHGYYINGEMPPASEKACNWLSTFLEGKENIKLAGGVPVNIQDHDLLIHTGFLM